MEIAFTTAGVIAAYVFLFLATLVIGKLINEWITPYNIDNQLVKKDNLALSVSFAGYFCAVCFRLSGCFLIKLFCLAQNRMKSCRIRISGMRYLNL